MSVTFVARAESTATLHKRFPNARIYALGIKGPISLRSFFGAVEEQLPTDPPLGNGTVWDALSDSLFSGLFAAPDDRVIIYWQIEGDLDQQQRDVIIMACEIFRERWPSVWWPKARATGDRWAWMCWSSPKA